jgi:hypothetical protein
VNDLEDIATVARIENNLCVAAVSMQFFVLPGKGFMYYPFVTLCMVSNLMTAKEHRGKGYARNLL